MIDDGHFTSLLLLAQEYTLRVLTEGTEAEQCELKAGPGTSGNLSAETGE